jgi:hypothetical protein
MRHSLQALLISSLCFGSLAFAGVKKGDVTLKIDSANAQISLGDHSVRQGDKVIVYKESCQGPRVSLCKKEKVGEAIVSRVLNEKASEIKTDGKMALEEGMIVEKEK